MFRLELDFFCNASESDKKELISRIEDAITEDCNCRFTIKEINGVVEHR